MVDLARSGTAGSDPDAPGGVTVQDARGADVRRVLPGMRRLLIAFALLTLLGFTALFVGSTQTERAFAWTIDTLLHLDRLHFASPELLARAAAWFWTAVYVVVPVAMLALLPLQERVPGGDPPRLVPLPRGLSAALAVQGSLLLAVGAVLFAVPAAQAVLWPWQLTPLTARTVGSWLIAFGFAAVLALRERDLERLELAAIAYTAFGALELVALARFAGVVRWGQPAAWVYLALLLTIVPTGAVGWAAVGRALRGRRLS